MAHCTVDYERYESCRCARKRGEREERRKKARDTGVRTSHSHKIACYYYYEWPLGLWKNWEPLTNHKKLSQQRSTSTTITLDRKPYRRQLGSQHIIKISSTPTFDVENDCVVARLRYLVSIDVSTAISKASIFGRFSWRRPLSSTIYGNNRFMTPPDHNLHYINILYVRWESLRSYRCEHQDHV